MTKNFRKIRSTGLEIDHPEKRSFLEIFRSDERGVSMIEFAFSVPILVMSTLVAIQAVEATITRIQVERIASLAADTTARYKSNISIGDIRDVMAGVMNSAPGLDFKKNGRIIITSVERNDADNGIWVNWQRCFGDKTLASQVGTEDKGYKDQSIQSIKLTDNDNNIKISQGTQAIIVELIYEYKPSVSVPYSPFKTSSYKTSSAFIVRERTANYLLGAYEMFNGEYRRVAGGNSRYPITDSRLPMYTCS